MSLVFDEYEVVVDLENPENNTLPEYNENTATEAVSTVMQLNGEAMKIFICTDKIIEENGLQPVSNATPFVNIAAQITSPDGLYSEEIFGYTQGERTINHAYIDLKRKFFHPYVYEILCELHSKIKEIVSSGGEKYYFINKEGKYQEVIDETDPNFNPDNTGLDYVIRTFRKLKYEKNESRKHNDNVDFIKTISDDEALITKFLVIPRSYRDFSSQGGIKSVDPVNNHYSKLISLCKSLESGISGYISHRTMEMVQMILVKLRQYGQELIEKKEGIIHKSVLAKNTTYGVRGVISVPSLVGCDFPDDCQVDILTTGLPLSTCIQAGYPFIIKWLNDWVEKNLYGGPVVVYEINPDTKKFEQKEVRIKNHIDIFDTKYLSKKLNQFVKGYGGRWKPIVVTTEDNKEMTLSFTGRPNASHLENHGTATIYNRALTWCDLFYMAAEDTLSTKHIYSTRYPVEDYFGTEPARLAVLSTIKTCPMYVNGKVYKHYPVIDPNADEITVSRAFIDTILVPNLSLAGYHGDYDGDTVSSKMVYSEEANVEAENFLFSMTNYMTIAGSMIRSLGNESILCMYTMTKRE